MEDDAAATNQSLQPTGAVYQVGRRPTTTFLVLDRIAGTGPEPGSYAGEVQIGGGRAPCGITVAAEGKGSEVWCSPRGPLPSVFVGDEAILQFAPLGATQLR